MLRQAHGAAYLNLVTRPSDAVLAAIGYTPTNTDRANIAASVFPCGMFNDNIHLLGSVQRLGRPGRGPSNGVKLIAFPPARASRATKAA